MEGEHTIHALRRKRAEVSGQVVRAEEALNQLRADLVHIDAVLRMFDPEADPDAIKPKREWQASGYFGPNELPRLIADTIRRNGTIATPDLTRAVMATNGYAADDPALYNAIMKKVRARLAASHKRGVLAREIGADGVAVWRVGS